MKAAEGVVKAELELGGAGPMMVAVLESCSGVEAAFQTRGVEHDHDLCFCFDHDLCFCFDRALCACLRSLAEVDDRGILVSDLSVDMYLRERQHARPHHRRPIA